MQPAADRPSVEAAATPCGDGEEGAVLPAEEEGALLLADLEAVAAEPLRRPPGLQQHVVAEQDSATTITLGDNPHSAPRNASAWEVDGDSSPEESGLLLLLSLSALAAAGCLRGWPAGGGAAGWS
ncbi:hypothetical protein ZWY2020_006270 [Hordeum vulgare]|nr:hypothetical protein ZWY2020_006270 [Hordeum vulgare]